MAVVDFAIVTGLLEEFEVLRRLVPSLVERTEGADTWYRGSVAAKNGVVYSVVAGFQDKMGPLDAGSLTTRLIRRWDPSYILLVGIAGTFSKDIRLGDVIVSQQVFYYDPGKATGTGIAYRPQGYPTSVILTRQLEALRLDPDAFGEWRAEAGQRAAAIAAAVARRAMKTGARLLLEKHVPQVHFGTIASGSLVIASKRKRTDLLRLHGKIIGTEMEGAGVMHASYQHELPTPAVVIKGISDAADAGKDQLDAAGHWRMLAMETPVRLALALMRRGQIRAVSTDRYQLDPRADSPIPAREMLGQASQGMALLTFPRVVVPYGPLTGLKITIDAQGPDGAVDVIKSAVTYWLPDGKSRDQLDVTGSHEITIAATVAARPISVYLMLRRGATSVRFDVETLTQSESATWKPAA